MEKTIYVHEYRALLKWLHDAREQSKLSLRELARRVGVHHSRIGRIEAGERRLDLLEFVRLCQVIGCNPHEGLDLVTKPLPKQDRPISSESRTVHEKTAKRLKPS